MLLADELPLKLDLLEQGFGARPARRLGATPIIDIIAQDAEGDVTGHAGHRAAPGLHAAKHVVDALQVLHQALEAGRDGRAARIRAAVLIDHGAQGEEPHQVRKRHRHGLRNRPGLGRLGATLVVDDAHHVGIALGELSAEIVEIDGGNALNNLGPPDTSHHLLFSHRKPPCDA